MSHLKIYPPSKQTFDNYFDVWGSVEDYVFNGKHTNQQRLIRFISSTEMPEDKIECYEAYQFGSLLQPPKYAVLRIKFNGTKDWVRWNELGSEEYTPNVIIHALERNHKQFKQYFDLFSDARISIWSEPHAHLHNMGNDGTNYELTFGNDFSLGVTYKWWEDTPGSWKPLAEKAMEAKYLIDKWITDHENAQ